MWDRKKWGKGRKDVRETRGEESDENVGKPPPQSDNKDISA